MLGRLDRGVDLLSGAGRNVGNRLLVDRGDVGERRLRRNPFAANPMARVHVYTLDGRSRHPRPCLSLEVVRVPTAVDVPQVRPAIVRAQTYFKFDRLVNPGKTG